MLSKKLCSYCELGLLWRNVINAGALYVDSMRIAVLLLRSASLLSELLLVCNHHVAFVIGIRLLSTVSLFRSLLLSSVLAVTVNNPLCH